VTFRTEDHATEVVRLWRSGMYQKSIAAKFGVSPQRISQVLRHAMALEKHPAISMELSARTRNALINWGVEPTPDGVSSSIKTMGDLCRVVSLGKKGIDELQRWLVRHGKPPIQ